MKPLSYKQEMGDPEKTCIREGPIGSCSIYYLYYFLPSACFGFSLPPLPTLVLFLVSKGRKLLLVILLSFF